MLLKVYVIGLVAAIPLKAQPTFLVSSLPATPGNSSSAYFSTNVDVTVFLNPITNSGPALPASVPPQTWDFSAVQQPNELILRTDITNQYPQGDAVSFLSATYAEEDTLAGTAIMGWRYYSIENGGRTYYGLDAPLPFLTPQAVFSTPCIDIPDSVRLFQTWTTNFYWRSIYLQTFAFSNYLSVTANADAWGTIILPQIGSMPTLRVHQVNSYCITEMESSPVIRDVQTNQYYYWLVPNLGIAAEVIILGSDAITSVTVPFTNSVQRMFFENYYTAPSVTGPTFASPVNLSAEMVGKSMVLNWGRFGNDTNYRIDTSLNVFGTNWLPVGYTPNTSWTDTVEAPQTYYRVVSVP